MHEKEGYPTYNGKLDRQRSRELRGNLGYLATDVLGIVVAIEDENGDVVIPDNIVEGE